MKLAYDHKRCDYINKILNSFCKSLALRICFKDSLVYFVCHDPCNDSNNSCSKDIGQISYNSSSYVGKHFDVENTKSCHNKENVYNNLNYYSAKL